MSDEARSAASDSREVESANDRYAIEHPHGNWRVASAATAASREQIEAWAAEADLHNAYEWANEEIRWRKALYVGTHSERDRRSIHAEAAQAIKKAHHFWASIPLASRALVATEAGLPLTAIPEDLRAA